jgi:uncharacterized protein (TIGR02246 family)
VNGEEQAIAEVLNRYEAALNASSTDTVMELYAADGVFMPQGSPSSVGRSAVRTAYDAVFAAITLSVKFDILEVKQTGPEWGFARTNSAGTVTVHANGQHAAEGNQELFVFQKVDGVWKIARYCFSTTNPAAA